MKEQLSNVSLLANYHYYESNYKASLAEASVCAKAMSDIMDKVNIMKMEKLNEKISRRITI